jgi:hypothetical protein
MAKSDFQLRHVCPSVCTSAWNNSAPNGRIFIKFDIRAFLENLSRKFKFDSNPIRVTCTLHEYLCTFMIISSLVRLRMRNILSKSCGESFPKIVPFIR